MRKTITSVWETNGHYSVAFNNRPDRKHITNSVAKIMLKQANDSQAIRKHLPVRGGGYVWFIDQNKVDLTLILNGH